MRDLTQLLNDFQGGNCEQFDNSVHKSDLSGLNVHESKNFESGFSEVIPLGTTDKLPEFPLDVLVKVAPKTTEFIFAAAESVQAPVDLVGSCTLATLQIACRGRFETSLPSGHIERPCFYIIPIAPPSERKSGVIEVVCRPLVDFELTYNKEHGGEINANKSEYRLLQARLSAAESELIRAKTSDDKNRAEKERIELSQRLAEFESIEPLRLYGADVTPEKLAVMLKSQKEVFALVSAEGGGIFENIGRYSDKGGLEIYLGGYSGDRVCIDRKTTDSVVLEHPCLSILAPCQPSVIDELFSDRQKSGRGLLSRMLFVKCGSRVGSRKFSACPIAEHVREFYMNLVNTILSFEGFGILTFDNNALTVTEGYFNEIERQMPPDTGELDFMGDWAGKLPGQMVRLAGLIHCIAAFEKGENPLESLINPAQAKAAVALSRFFLAHAKAVYSEQAEPIEIKNAKYLWKMIKSDTWLRKKAVYIKTRRKKGFDLDESLSVLVSHGYIRIEKVSTGGRPYEQIIINQKARNMYV
jgi:hypothetical protein